MVRDLINEFGWCFSLFVFCIVNFAILWWTLEALVFLQKIWGQGLTWGKTSGLVFVRPVSRTLSRLRTAETGDMKMANKFATNVQVEEDKAYQDWLDAEELKDIKALELRMENVANGEPA